MSDPRPTKAQWTAIKELDTDLSVSAGAGAGKTWVLTERYTAMLAGRPLVLPPLELEATERNLAQSWPARPGQIVAITFTKEAAAEMKARIRERLNLWKRTAAPVEQRLIGQLKEEVERAAITTIHGFCSDLLRQYPLEAGVDPQFRVLEESEARVALEEALRAVLDEGLTAGSEAVIRLVTEYGYEALVDHLARFYQGVREHTEDFAGMAEQSLAKLDELADGLEADVERLIGCMERIAQVDLSQKDTSKGSAKRGADVQAAWPDLSLQLHAWRADNLPYRADVAERLIDLTSGWGVLIKELKADVNELKAIAMRVIGKLVPDEMRLAVRDVCDVLERVHTAFVEHKRKERGLDFTDLQNRAVRLLHHPQAGLALAQQLRYLMVDEFQDTNPVQKGLLDALRTQNPELKLFVVGDAKQSIYRFRGADLEVFVETQRAIQDRGGEHVALAHNFRTQAPVISFVNRLFERVMPELQDGPQFAAQYEAMVATRESSHGGAMVEILHLSGADDAATSKLKEAQAIAKRIKEMVGQELLVPAEDGLRPVQYRDVTLLFSAMTHLTYYEHALQEQGIPYYIIGSRHFFRRQEVWDLMLLLQAVVDERDVVAKIGALRSPLFGVSDDALYWLGKQGLLSEVFEELETWSSVAPDDQEKLQFAARCLNSWREEQGFLSAGELVARILEVTGYEQALLLTFGGSQKVGNVRKLLDLAYDQSPERAGVLPFLQDVKVRVEAGVDEADAQVESEQSDVVKIMTVHKSKGLEFPIVILPDLAREFHLRSEGKFHYDPAFGLVPTFTEHEAWNEMGYVPQLRELDRSKALEEERRKLYVAMTRARDYLLLVGSREVPKKRMTLENSRWFDWLVAAMADGELTQMASSIQAEWPEVKWTSELEAATVRAADMPQILVQAEPEAERSQSPLRASDKVVPRRSMLSGGAPAVFPVLAAWEEVAAAGASAGAFAPAQTVERLHHLFPLTQHVQTDRSQGILLSVSALLTYLACPRQYFYQAVLRLPEVAGAKDVRSDTQEREVVTVAGVRSLSATERGSLVHRVLELLDEPDQAKTLLKRALAERGIGESDAEAVLPELQRDVDAYLQSPLFQEVQTATTRHSEWMFRLMLGPHEVTGVMDKVVRRADGAAVVIDFKTNRITEGSLLGTAQHYTPQLQLYTLVVKRLLKWEVERSVLYFTALGKEAQVSVRDADLEKMERTVRTALDHIATHDQEEAYAVAPDERPCQHCGYRLLCKGEESLDEEEPQQNGEQLSLF
ncbi:UvrD-helicase domain-containing protein [Tumebacillus algifaecis]|nr:UvrD-helicase domain-containing protein [Tumebacillus algifaecis]